MKSTKYHWAVVGAGPAGIAAVGRLLDSGVPAPHLLWLDPEFKVGDLGVYWRSVSSNTTVARFLDFLKVSPAFNYESGGYTCRLNELPPEQTCLLAEVVKPLQWVTDELRKQVQTVQAHVQNLALKQGQWQIQTPAVLFQATNVILATGAEPLHLAHEVPALAFYDAISREKLRALVKKEGTYAVFGSSHSAIIILQSLVELGVSRVINFYRSPCRYAVVQGDWTLFDNTGLKGDAATWARRFVDGTWPANLERYVSNEENVVRYLPQCHAAIYAVGFQRRLSFQMEGGIDLHSDPHHGILAPGLFGFGIGFPERAADPFGHVETQVGLWKFMVYLNKVLPLWHSYALPFES